MFNNNPELLIKFDHQLFARQNLKISTIDDSQFLDVVDCQMKSAGNNADISQHILAEKKTGNSSRYVRCSLFEFVRTALQTRLLGSAIDHFAAPFGRKLIALHIILISVGGSKNRPESLRNETVV